MNSIKLTRTSPMTGEKNTLSLPLSASQYFFWVFNNREHHIQNLFPHLTADQREFMISGMYPGEWEELFKEEQ